LEYQFEGWYWQRSRIKTLLIFLIPSHSSQEDNEKRSRNKMFILEEAVPKIKNASRFHQCMGGCFRSKVFFYQKKPFVFPIPSHRSQEDNEKKVRTKCSASKRRFQKLRMSTGFTSAWENASGFHQCQARHSVAVANSTEDTRTNSRVGKC
jgi:hypothetical protein